MSPETLSKDEIRLRHRTARAGMQPDALAAAATGIALHGLSWAQTVTSGRPSTFTAYLGVGFEPPTLPLISALHNAGHRVLLPVCEPDRTLGWVFWDPAVKFVRSRYAPIQEPDGERQGLDVMRSVAGIFLPATAVDMSGNRIGQGGGYYDKFLALAESNGVHVPRTAVIFDADLLPPSSIPAESFDRPVDAVLSPSGLTRLT